MNVMGGNVKDHTTLVNKMKLLYFFKCSKDKQLLQINICILNVLPLRIYSVLEVSDI